MSTIPTAVTAAYELDGCSFELNTTGLINRTWLVSCNDSHFVLQRVSDIFDEQVNDRIDSATKHLAAQGFNTTRIVKTADGRNAVAVDGATWRVLTFLPGHCFEVAAKPAITFEAGRMLGEFHVTLNTIPDRSLFKASGVHDLQKHLSTLRDSLTRHHQHRAYTAVADIAKQMFDLAETLPVLPNHPSMLIHGDPKLSNFIFDEHNHALSLIDLDTIGTGSLLNELGDAFRSWCNPAGEDDRNASFSLPHFEASLAGYAQSAPKYLQPYSAAEIVAAVQLIYTELAARFCADALNESYFGWDSETYESASDHNQVRATSQLNAAMSIRAQHDDAIQIAATILT